MKKKQLEWFEINFNHRHCFKLVHILYSTCLSSESSILHENTPFPSLDTHTDDMKIDQYFFFDSVYRFFSRFFKTVTSLECLSNLPFPYTIIIHPCMCIRYTYITLRTFCICLQFLITWNASIVSNCVAMKTIQLLWK